MIVGHRHFSSWDQKEIAVIFKFEKIGFELWQLRRSEERGAVDDERRQRFEVTVLASLDFEHEVNERTFKPRAGAVQNRKTCRRDLCSPLEIENAEPCAKVNMVLRFESKLRRRAPATNLNIVGLIRTGWYACVRDVGKG